MIDFLKISTRSPKKGVVEIYPKFIIKKSSDLMIRGGDFYAIWIEELCIWSTDEQDALQLIDRELDQYAREHNNLDDISVKVLHMWDSDTGMIDKWHKYCQKHMRDSFHMLDESLIFSNTETKKEDYSSKRLSYPLEPGNHESWDKLVSTLYSDEERLKIEWAIGSIISGDSKKIQKFMVLYGSAGTGKSTILNIIQKLFEGYYSVFDAKALGSSSNSFALEAFKTNPLVAIQHDGDLSRIEDNTRLNSLVSHELMTVNEKFKSTYSNRFKSFLFMGTNKPVKITDAKSGLIRRLIDVSPTGKKVSPRQYVELMNKINFELGAIASYCLDVYESNKRLFDDYIPVTMMGASNDFYNFVEDYYPIFNKQDGISLTEAYTNYKKYCTDANVPYPLSRRLFKEELKNYFWTFEERHTLEDGSRIRSYYSDFRTDRFDTTKPEKVEDPKENWIELKRQDSIFDKECRECPAQYATKDGTPTKKWDNITSKLEMLDTTQLHYVKVPENHIVIDFDICGPDGTKSKELNIEAANKWPRTYAELSKSGSAVHLHYIYNGDPKKLSRVFDEHIEIKVFTGNSSLRRKLSECNDIPIATISSGLPQVKGEKMVNKDIMITEKGIRTTIKKCLNKEIHDSTKPNVDFIFKILDDAYKSGIQYDVTDMRNAIIAFAANSTNQAEACLKLVNSMQFKSKTEPENIGDSTDEIVFYDVEVFPNLFLVNYKKQGPDNSVVRLINPTPSDIEEMCKFKLVGFNCRRYDNHILYARMMGYSNLELYKLSQKIISGSKNCFFGEAYNLSYTDVLDFSSKKQSLKKFEIELGIHHQELGLPWDEPVPEEKWQLVAEYCDNDVIATEAVFEARKADFIAREVLADVAGMTVNDTTNSLTTRIIFGKDRRPQCDFNYRFMGDMPTEGGICTMYEPGLRKNYEEGDYNVFTWNGQPIFPGYKFERGVSTYRDINPDNPDPKRRSVGEGGFVYAEPGMYTDVALLDIASMHPSSIIAEELFGPEYTKRFQEIKDARVAIKHKDFDKAKTMLDGALAKYLDDESKADDLAQALKIAINSVYGLTSATFENPFRDTRNADNIVAKRGALFMINLKHEVAKRGFAVAHIKTDSIKIPNATPEIIKYVTDYGKDYGYIFEHEATYSKMTLVNDAVYVAKYATVEHCEELYSKEYVESSPEVCAKNKKKAGHWETTGTQFQIPYVKKFLFTKEPIEFEDMCETKSVTSSLYLDMNEDLTDVSIFEKERDKLLKKLTTPLDDESEAIQKNIDILNDKIAKGHCYIFVGKVGQFCPMKPGAGGGWLMREKDGKYNNATGAKGYRWMESEMVKNLGKEDLIDRGYYQELVDKAVETISGYGDFEWFVSDDEEELQGP